MENTAPQALTDEKLQKIGFRLEYYRQVSRRDVYMMDLHQKLENDIRDYLANSGSHTADQQKAGRLIWKLKSYFRRGFFKNAGALTDFALKTAENNQVLSEKDKINFADFLISSHLTRYVNVESFNILSRVSPHGEYGAKRFWPVVCKAVDDLKKPVKDVNNFAEKSKRLYNFMAGFVYQSKEVERDQIYKISACLFDMSEKLASYNRTAPEGKIVQVSLMPIASMLVKSAPIKEIYAKNGRLFPEEPPENQKPKKHLDVGAFCQVLRLYRQQVMKHKRLDNFNGRLYIQMLTMNKTMVQHCAFTPKEIDRVCAALTDRKEKKPQQTHMDYLANQIRQEYKQTLPRKQPSLKRMKLSPYTVGEHFYLVNKR